MWRQGWGRSTPREARRQEKRWKWEGDCSEAAVSGERGVLTLTLMMEKSGKRGYHTRVWGDSVG